MPISNGSHWFLTAVDVITKELSAYCSVGFKYAKETKSISDLVCNVLKQKGTPVSVLSYLFPDVLRQPNAIDYYVLNYIRQIVFGPVNTLCFCCDGA